jgi:hypothetical protein
MLILFINISFFLPTDPHEYASVGITNPANEESAYTTIPPANGTTPYVNVGVGRNGVHWTEYDYDASIRALDAHDESIEDNRTWVNSDTAGQDENYEIPNTARDSRENNDKDYEIPEVGRQLK